MKQFARKRINFPRKEKWRKSFFIPCTHTHTHTHTHICERVRTAGSRRKESVIYLGNFSQTVGRSTVSLQRGREPEHGASSLIHFAGLPILSNLVALSVSHTRFHLTGYPLIDLSPPLPPALLFRIAITPCSSFSGLLQRDGERLSKPIPKKILRDF